jgi:hypothetical protein
MESAVASLGWVSRIITYVAAALAALMMVHVTLDVILGQFIAEPLPGTVDYVPCQDMAGAVLSAPGGRD